MTINFFIPIEPVAKGRPRFTRRGFIYTPKETLQYENFIRNALVNKSEEFLEIYNCALTVELKFFISKPKSVKREYPHIRPDLDNYIKAVLDSFNGIVFHDDGQIISLSASKRYHETPGIEVWIESK